MKKPTNRIKAYEKAQAKAAAAAAKPAKTDAEKVVVEAADHTDMLHRHNIGSHRPAKKVGPTPNAPNASTHLPVGRMSRGPGG